MQMVENENMPEGKGLQTLDCSASVNCRGRGGWGGGVGGGGGDREKGYSVSVESSLNHVQNETKNGRKQKTKKQNYEGLAAAVGRSDTDSETIGCTCIS